MSDFRLVAIDLDDSGTSSNPVVMQEREVAISDLLESNEFRPVRSSGGPYRLTLGVQENRLLFHIALADGTPHGEVTLSLTPFRKVIKDYFLLCDSYYKAIQTAQPAQLESLDMGRRALHDEGSGLLQKRLAGKIAVDFDTARRLFTLICALHMKG